MIAPDWMNETVRGFGRQMGLSSFALNDRGAAGVRFENGVSLRLEYVPGALVMSAGVAMEPRAESLRRLLTGAHPAAVPGVGVRAAWMARSGEGVYIVRIDERRVDVSAMEAAFRVVWQLASSLGRSLA